MPREEDDPTWKNSTRSTRPRSALFGTQRATARRRAAHMEWFIARRHALVKTGGPAAGVHIMPRGGSRTRPTSSQNGPS